MVEMSCDSRTYTYTFKINGSYEASADCVEKAKKRILERIEVEMNAAINKKLDSSLVE